MRIQHAQVHLLGLPLSDTRAFLAELRRHPGGKRSKDLVFLTFGKLEIPTFRFKSIFFLEVSIFILVGPRSGPQNGPQSGPRSGARWGGGDQR